MILLVVDTQKGCFDERLGYYGGWASFPFL